MWSCIASSIFFNEEKGRAHIYAKENCILAGLAEGVEVFNRCGARTTQLTKDGDEVKADENVMEIEGSLRSILAGERLTLNFLSRMSGIASLTNELVCICKKKNANIAIAATRKTTPGFRKYEKKAVVIGGGISTSYGPL